MPVYGIAETAQRDLRAAVNRARHAMDYGIIKDGLWHKVSLEEAQRMYRTEAAKILREAHVEVNPDSPVAIQCANCKNVEKVARDVKTFRCKCSPHEEQWTHQCRSIDLGRVL